MKRLILFLLLLLPSFSEGQMTIVTVAGSDTATSWNEGGMATNAKVAGVYGLWFDRNCNLYFADDSGFKIRKVNANTGIITTIGGTNVNWSYDSGDGGPAVDASMLCDGLYADVSGNVYFANRYTGKVRKIDAATGIITTIAGEGTLLGDGGPATNADLGGVTNIYGDDAGNIYIAEYARIRKINSAGIITTIAGTGKLGFSGDGGFAVEAQIRFPQGMLLDGQGNFYFADVDNHRIRKIDTYGVITTYAGTDTLQEEDGYLAAKTTLGKVSSFVIDYLGNMAYCDNQHGVIRKIDAPTGIVSTVAGKFDGGVLADGIPINETSISADYMYLDRSGNIYFSRHLDRIRKITGYLPGLAGNVNDCGETAVKVVAEACEVKLYPNPVADVLHVASPLPSPEERKLCIYNLMGKVMRQETITEAETEVSVSMLPSGVYYLSIRGSNGVAVKRFVKE